MPLFVTVMCCGATTGVPTDEVSGGVIVDGVTEIVGPDDRHVSCALSVSIIPFVPCTIRMPLPGIEHCTPSMYGSGLFGENVHVVIPGHVRSANVNPAPVIVALT